MGLLIVTLLVGSMAIAFCLNESQSETSSLTLTFQTIGFLIIVIYLANQVWDNFQRPYAVLLGTSVTLLVLAVASIGLLRDGPLGMILGIAGLALIVSAVFLMLAKNYEKTCSMREKE